MVYASLLRAGMAIRHEGQVYKVLMANYHPGQGKMGGATHVRLRNLSTGSLWEQSFRAELKLDDLPIEKQSMEFLYSEAEETAGLQRFYTTRIANPNPPGTDMIASGQ